MSNFAFLAQIPEYQMFSAACIEAEQVLCTSAAMCAIGSRKALELADRHHIQVDRRSLVRGALLHDYFLYDWHDPDPSHRWHGFFHPQTALKNAERDFSVGDTERDMIAHHMFPLVPRPPRCRESALLCLADKLCALRETVRQF